MLTGETRIINVISSVEIIIIIAISVQIAVSKINAMIDIIITKRTNKNIKSILKVPSKIKQPLNL